MLIPLFLKIFDFIRNVFILIDSEQYKKAKAITRWRNCAQMAAYTFYSKEDTFFRFLVNSLKPARIRKTTKNHKHPNFKLLFFRRIKKKGVCTVFRIRKITISNTTLTRYTLYRRSICCTYERIYKVYLNIYIYIYIATDGHYVCFEFVSKDDTETTIYLPTGDYWNCPTPSHCRCRDGDWMTTVGSWWRI